MTFACLTQIFFLTVLDKVLEDYERNGLALPKEQREKLKDIKKSESSLIGLRYFCVS